MQITFNLNPEQAIKVIKYVESLKIKLPSPDNCRNHKSFLGDTGCTIRNAHDCDNCNLWAPIRDD